MILARLTADNFRNLAHAELSFHPAVNILVGRNAQGKTNLLEAIYFLATTKSFRTTRLTSLVRFDAPNVYVAGAIERDGLTRQHSAGIEFGESRRRVLLINGEKIALHAYVSAMTVFAYSSARLEIVRGRPEERRRFLDRGIATVDGTYLDALARHARVLRQRNALLQDVAAGRQSATSLDSWDNEFFSAAERIQKARAAYTSVLAEEVRDVIAAHRYRLADLTIAYEPSVATDDRPTRAQEIRARVSLTGPQRDNVEFLVGGRPAAEVLSGGEQKMLVLFLKFAKIAVYRARSTESPLLLLDDIDAELDLDVLQQLLSNLPPATQLFATSAKEAFLDILSHGQHRRLTLENGQVTAERDFV